ncbi:MAG: exodeoxyribonuclease V subunit gamma, partial [Armatimonadota bacterium]
MAKVTILIGPPHTGKSAWAIERYIAAVAGRPPGPHGDDAALLLLPTARRAAEVQREVLADERIGALFDARIMTFPQFAQLLLTANHAEGAKISPMAERLILRQVVQELAAADKLPYLEQVKDYTGFIEALSQLIGELKRAAVDPARFEEGLRAAGLDDQRSHDLAAIYAGYQMTLIARDVFDAEGLFWWARDILRRGDRRPFEELREIIVDGFWDFTTTQLDVLKLLVDGVDTAAITLARDDAPEAAELFEFTNRTLERLSDTFPDAAIEPGPGARVLESPLEHLGGRLFRRTSVARVAGQPVDSSTPASTGSDLPVPHAEGSIHIMEAPGRRREVEEIAREIKTLVLCRKARPDEIAVVVRRVDEYADLLRTTFARYGIPLCVTRGLPALRRPVVQTVLGIYAVVANDYRRDDVINLLNSNYVTFSPDGGADLSADELSRLARTARIVGGRDTWERRFGVRARRLERIIERGDEVEDEEQEYAEGSEALEELAALERARACTQALFELLDRIPRRATLQEHATALVELVEALNIPAQVPEAQAPKASAGDIHAFRELMRTLEELRLAANQYVPAKAPEPVYTPGEFVDDLRTILNRTTYDPEQSGEGRVLAADAFDVRQLHFPFVFIAGLTEREFPRQRRECPFYRDAEREQLAKAGLALEPRLLRQREEMLLFHSAATCATQRLYLTHPATDAEGKEVLSSHYVDEVRECFPEPLPERHVRVSQTVPALADAACEQELLEGAFHTLWHPDAQKPARVAAAYNRVAARRPRAVACGAAGALVERERDSREPPAEFDGVLGDTAIVRDLASRFPDDYLFSASQFNEYGQCPMRYFLKRVLRLKELEEPTEIISPRERGGLLHRILRRTHEALAKRRAEHEAITEALVAEARPAVERIVDEQFDADVRLGAVVDEALWDIERVECKRDMALVLDKEVELGAGGHVPTYFEAEYGTDEVPALCIGDGDGKQQVLLRGRIDRIDMLHDDGAPQGFAVFDYKSGGAGSTSDILGGRDFQLPVYALAAELVLGDADETECCHWAYYRVRRPVEF